MEKIKYVGQLFLEAPFIIEASDGTTTVADITVGACDKGQLATLEDIEIAVNLTAEQVGGRIMTVDEYCKHLTGDLPVATFLELDNGEEGEVK